MTRGRLAKVRLASQVEVLTVLAWIIAPECGITQSSGFMLVEPVPPGASGMRCIATRGHARRRPLL
jgi:hypothetical protein